MPTGETAQCRLLFFVGGQLESWSAGRIARPTSGSDLCLENPGWKK
jgi:hypothetical protein